MTDASMHDWDLEAAHAASTAWTGAMVGRDNIDTLLAEVGATFHGVFLGDVEGRRVLDWDVSWMMRKGDVVRITAVFTFEAFEEHGPNATERVVEIRDSRARLIFVNGRECGDVPHNAAPVVLWRIEDVVGLGPFRLGEALRDMNLAMTGDADVCWHQTAMPTPADEGLDQFRHLCCAAPSPRQLVRWFPRAARRALSRHDYRLVRIECPPGSAQVGGTQALYNPQRARVLETRPL